MQRTAALLITSTLIAAACGGGQSDEASGEEALAAAIRDQALVNPDNPLDRETTTCLADGVVAEFGVEKLAELGVTVENPNVDLGRIFSTRDQAERTFNLAFDCIEFDSSLLSFLPEGLEIANDSLRCLGDGLNTDTFRDFYVSFVLGENNNDRVIDDPAAQVSIGQLVLGCLNAEELLRFTQLGG